LKVKSQLFENLSGLLAAGLLAAFVRKIRFCACKRKPMGALSMLSEKEANAKLRHGETAFCAISRNRERIERRRRDCPGQLPAGGKDVDGIAH